VAHVINQVPLIMSTPRKPGPKTKLLIRSENSERKPIFVGVGLFSRLLDVHATILPLRRNDLQYFVCTDRLKRNILTAILIIVVM
jgi:hypothetical protein